MSADRVALAIGGRLSAGKTSVARALTRELDAAYLSFGDYVRAKAVERGIPGDRFNLQRLGRELRKELGPRRFCEEVLAAKALSPADLPVVWDGVRHVEIVHMLRSIYAHVSFHFIVLAPPEDERRERLIEQSGDELRAREWEKHESEQHFDDLLPLADLVVHAATVERAVAEIRLALRPSPTADPDQSDHKRNRGDKRTGRDGI